MKYFKQFGGKLTEDLKQQYALSPQWDGKKFVNQEETLMEIKPKNIPGLIRQQFFSGLQKQPRTSLPILPLSQDEFLSDSVRMKYIWYGHSVLLMRINQKTLLIDPMLGPNAAPIAPFAIRRFSDQSLKVIDDFPDIDLLLMTHDHYDHLDYASILRLKSKVKHYYVALGVGRHLESWGISPEKITEFDWWQNQLFEGIHITFTPSRHFSGRGPRDRASSLWGGWVFQTQTENIYFSGDGGYGKHFSEVGSTLGPFDFGWMECGQYNPNWHAIHMYPEESVQAAQDAGVKIAMPVHWGGFSLAPHDWREPVERFVKAAVKQNLPYQHPPLGQLVHPEENHTDRWWEAGFS